VEFIAGIALLVNTGVLIQAVNWAVRIFRAFNELRGEVGHLRADVGQLHEAVGGLRQDIQASEQRVVAAVEGAQRAMQKSRRDLDWTIDHLLDGEMPGDLGDDAKR